jgi:hypothetical protein
VDACGGLDDWLGETEPEPELESESELEPKNELPSAASWLIREESSRAPLPLLRDEVGMMAALPGWAPLRTSSERTPKPATATPADAALSRRARRRAGARREGVLDAAVDTHP